jgi:ribosomal protein S18 acetylase RimI-like enzyme
MSKEMRFFLFYSGSGYTGMGGSVWSVYSANDRLKYQRLLKYYDLIDNPHDKVCSIVCFRVHPDYRRKGIARKLLEQIIADYSKRDYDYIEAYPGIGQLSCERFYKGPLELYKEFGFRIEREVNDYSIVRKKLR